MNARDSLTIRVLSCKIPWFSRAEKTNSILHPPDWGYHPVLVARPSKSKMKDSDCICDIQCQWVTSTVEFCSVTPSPLHFVFSLLVGDRGRRIHLGFIKEGRHPLEKNLPLIFSELIWNEYLCPFWIAVQFVRLALRSKPVRMILVICCHDWEFADDPWKLLNYSVWKLNISILKLRYFPVT